MVSQYKHPDYSNHSYTHAGFNQPQVSYRRFIKSNVVLAEQLDIEDSDCIGKYTVKAYHSGKIEEGGVLINQSIVLKPEASAYGYSPIVIENNGEELVVVGEWLGTITS